MIIEHARRRVAAGGNPSAIHENNMNSLRRQKSIRSVANRLPLIKITTLNQKLFAKTLLSCPICALDYKKDENIIILPCDPRYLFVYCDLYIICII